LGFLKQTTVIKGKRGRKKVKNHWPRGSHTFCTWKFPWWE